MALLLRVRIPAFIVLIVSSVFVAGMATAQDRSSDYTAPYQVRALEIYRASIGFRTALGHGKVPELAAYLAAQFRAGGFPGEDIRVLPIELAGGEKTASLVVRYRGDGSSGMTPILLMAHMDVVEALPEDWERDPFTLVEEGGYFFGRGSFDDKFGMVMLTATFLRLKSEGFTPGRDLIIAFSGDEETDQISTNDLYSVHRDLVNAEFALNADAGGGVLDASGKPVSYLLQAAEKTYATFELTTHNPGGHSSMPRIDNAIYDLADALEKLHAWRFPVRSNDVTLRYFAEAGRLRTGELGEAMTRFAADPADSGAADVLFRYPAQVGFTRTTCIATMLRGGHAENALPQSATATVNCRIFPGVSVEEVEATIRKVVNNDQVQISVLGDPEPSPASALREDVLEAVTTAVRSVYPNTPVIPVMSSYGTDGKYSRASGIPTYGTMGAFIRDEDDFTHGLNERIPVRSFYRALEYWHVLLTKLAGS